VPPIGIWEVGRPLHFGTMQWPTVETTRDIERGIRAATGWSFALHTLRIRSHDLAASSAASSLDPAATLWEHGGVKVVRSAVPRINRRGVLIILHDGSDGAVVLSEGLRSYFVMGRSGPDSIFESSSQINDLLGATYRLGALYAGSEPAHNRADPPDSQQLSAVEQVLLKVVGEHAGEVIEVEVGCTKDPTSSPGLWFHFLFSVAGPVALGVISNAIYDRLIGGQPTGLERGQTSLNTQRAENIASWVVCSVFHEGECPYYRCDRSTIVDVATRHDDGSWTVTLEDTSYRYRVTNITNGALFGSVSRKAK
jgi:hypothetical protein